MRKRSSITSLCSRHIARKHEAHTEAPHLGSVDINHDRSNNNHTGRCRASPCMAAQQQCSPQQQRQPQELRPRLCCSHAVHQRRPHPWLSSCTHHTPHTIITSSSSSSKSSSSSVLFKWAAAVTVVLLLASTASLPHCPPQVTPCQRSATHGAGQAATAVSPVAQRLHAGTGCGTAFRFQVCCRCCGPFGQGRGLAR